MSPAKRAFYWVLILAMFGVIGGVVALTATNPKIPHPWGDIRLMHYSTNADTTMAHFRFQNRFDWPVMVEVGMEVRNDRTWEMARGYLLFSPIERPVGGRSFQNVTVPVPFGTKEWRVLVRAAKAELTKTDRYREGVKVWLDSHGAGFLGQKIQLQDPNGYLMAGPVMKWDKPGRLPTPHY